MASALASSDGTGHGAHQCVMRVCCCAPPAPSWWWTCGSSICTEPRSTMKKLRPHKATVQAHHAARLSVTQRGSASRLHRVRPSTASTRSHARQWVHIGGGTHRCAVRAPIQLDPATWLASTSPGQHPAPWPRELSARVPRWPNGRAWCGWSGRARCGWSGRVAPRSGLLAYYSVSSSAWHTVEPGANQWYRQPLASSPICSSLK